MVNQCVKLLSDICTKGFTFVYIEVIHLCIETAPCSLSDCTYIVYAWVSLNLIEIYVLNWNFSKFILIIPVFNNYPSQSLAFPFHFQPCQKRTCVRQVGFWAISLEIKFISIALHTPYDITKTLQGTAEYCSIHCTL